MGVWHIHSQPEMESCCLLWHMCGTGMVWDGLHLVGVRPFSRGSPVLVDQNVVDGGWCGELGRPGWVTYWFVDVITCIIRNEKVLNRMQNSPRGSPASWVFPHVLKSPRRVHQHVISILGMQTHQCVCTAWSSCFRIVGGERQWQINLGGIRGLKWWVAGLATLSVRWRCCMWEGNRECQGGSEGKSQISKWFPTEVRIWPKA